MIRGCCRRSTSMRVPPPSRWLSRFDAQARPRLCVSPRVHRCATPHFLPWQLANALATNMVRVIDLFREWDDDESGSVSKKEFRKAMPMLGLNVAVQHVEALFDEWDADKSGQLAIAELSSLLRKRIELDPSLMPGAAGEIELNLDQNIALRKGKVNKMDSNILQGLDIIEDGKPVHEQASRPRPSPRPASYPPPPPDSLGDRREADQPCSSQSLLSLAQPCANLRESLSAIELRVPSDPSPLSFDPLPPSYRPPRPPTGCSITSPTLYF